MAEIYNTSYSFIKLKGASWAIPGRTE